jgi:hypothetical protein
MQKRKSRKGLLVKLQDEKVPASKLAEREYRSRIPNSKTRGWGVYALFDGPKLYYIGLSNTSIRSRLKRHTRDRLKGQWTHFSFYQIRRGKYVKDLETILLRIYKPPGNKALGKFPGPKLSKIVEKEGV